MMSDLDTLANFVKDNFPQDAHMPDLQVSVAPSSVACPEGKVVMVLPGNGTELERTKCGKFPRELIKTSRFPLDSKTSTTTSIRDFLNTK